MAEWLTIERVGGVWGVRIAGCRGLRVRALNRVM